MKIYNPEKENEYINITPRKEELEELVRIKYQKNAIEVMKRYPQVDYKDNDSE